jgi:hypothetical protein
MDASGSFLSNAGMKRALTLPSLQAMLDALAAAGSLTLSKRQMERLFGWDEMAAGQVRAFTKAHRCTVAHSDGCTMFLKLPDQRHEAPL